MTSKAALQRGLIDQHIYLLIENRIAQLRGALPDSISINEALSWGLLLVPLGRVRNPANDRRMTIEEACDTGACVWVRVCKCVCVWVREYKCVCVCEVVVCERVRVRV